MSYDLHLTHRFQATQTGFAEIARDWPVMPDPVAAAVNEQILTELSASDYRFVYSSVYFNEIQGWMVEIFHDNGAIIKLIPGQTRLRLPFWYPDPAEAERTLAEFCHFAEIIQGICHCPIYDPQLEAEIDPAQDFERMLALYTTKMATFGNEREASWGVWPPSSTL